MVVFMCVTSVFICRMILPRSCSLEEFFINYLSLSLLWNNTTHCRMSSKIIIVLLTLWHCCTGETRQRKSDNFTASAGVVVFSFSSRRLTTIRASSVPVVCDLEHSGGNTLLLMLLLQCIVYIGDRALTPSLSAPLHLKEYVKA